LTKAERWFMISLWTAFVFMMAYFIFPLISFPAFAFLLVSLWRFFHFVKVEDENKTVNP